MHSTTSNAAASLGGIGSGVNAWCHSGSLAVASTAAAPQPLDEAERMLSLQVWHVRVTINAVAHLSAVAMWHVLAGVNVRRRFAGFRCHELD